MPLHRHGTSVHVASLSAILLALLLPAGPAAAQEAFPHRTHDRLFPLCGGCHQVGTQDPSALYPRPAQCAECHDGQQAPAVEWSPPAASGYRHADHGELAGVELGCRDCHDAGGSLHAVDLGASCARCHTAHHSADARCRSCHEPGPRALHDASAHAGCAGAGCHETDRVSGLTFSRELCLVCHRDMTDHRPEQRCARCHAVGPSGSGAGREPAGTGPGRNVPDA